jgi:hypothetical protein
MNLKKTNKTRLRRPRLLDNRQGSQYHAVKSPGTAGDASSFDRA